MESPHNSQKQTCVFVSVCLCLCVCVCVRVSVCGCAYVYVVYEDTNLYNDMSITRGAVRGGELGRF